MTADSPDAPRAGSRPPRSRAVQFAAIGVGVVMALLVVLLVTRKAIEDRTEASPVVGKKAPELAGQPYIGRRFDIGKNDRWLLVNFFSTSCVPCVAEHPELQAFQREHAHDGLARVVSVVYGSDTKASVRAFFEQRGASWTVLDSDDGQTALDWGVSKVPESFLVDPNGYVRLRIDTGNGVTKAELDGWIRQAQAQDRGGK